jgi:glycine cleavage system H protein
MTTDMTKILCTKSHEYLVKENNLLKIGVTDFAVEQLGDVVFIELPEIDSKFQKGDIFGTIESVKAASELYMPVGGTVVEINEKVVEQPELINNDCFGEGWLIKVKEFKESEIQEAMPYDEYKEFLEEEE